MELGVHRRMPNLWLTTYSRVTGGKVGALEGVEPGGGWRCEHRPLICPTAWLLNVIRITRCAN